MKLKKMQKLIFNHKIRWSLKLYVDVMNSVTEVKRKEFIGDILLWSKIRKFFQTLIRILKHGHTVNTLGDFLFGFKIRKILALTEFFNSNRLLTVNS